MRNYQTVIESIHQELSQLKNKGKIASYIPELSCVNTNNFGIYLTLIDGENCSVGNVNTSFSIQSISKVLALTKAFSILGNSLWKRVDIEPSGNPFNHLSLLERENGIPRNPLINAGAIVIADMLVSNLKNPKDEFLTFVRGLANDDNINYNESVALSEKKTGFKNYATANLLKSFNNLENDVEDVLDFYFHQCSIEMTCQQLSNAFYLFANKGTCLQNIKHLSLSQVKRLNALMLTCGFYDEAGEFAFKVGLPGKSGVGGGIVALLPNVFTIATWSPGLNDKGNSLIGMKALELFTTKTERSIF
jgi:glutaminase